MKTNLSRKFHAYDDGIVRGHNKWSHAVPISTVPAGRSPADEASQQCDALGIVDHLGQGVQPARLISNKLHSIQ
jgi:hypothetical protein